MATSREWTTSTYTIVDRVLNSIFCKECDAIGKLTKPLIRVFRIVNSNDRLQCVIYIRLFKEQEKKC